MIENTNSSIVYVADGNTNTWNIPFEYKDADDITIVVQTKSGTNEVTSNFEINTQTNKVIYPTVESGLAFLTNGDKILVERNVEISQLEDSSLVKFEDNDIEREFDKLTMISQDIKRETDLSVKYSPFYTGDKLTANEFIDKVKDYSDSAEESARTASNQATIAQNHANQAYLNRLETIEQATIATNKAQDAKTSETNAYNSKVDAKNSEEEAKAVLASASKLLQEEGQKVIEELKGEITIPGYSMIVYEVGTVSGAYDGSLRKFPAKEPFMSNSTYVMVNGTWQQRDFEYKEDVDGLGITFEYDLLLGDKVCVMTSAGFFEKKNIETFAEAIDRHDKSTEAHSDIRESIKNAGYESHSEIELGTLGINENLNGNKKITFDYEPTTVSIRFSDRNRKMWINGSHSTAGIKSEGNGVYSIYYNINSDDFKEQNVLLPPFDVQYVIKYMADEFVEMEDFNNEVSDRKQADIDLDTKFTGLLNTEKQQRETKDNELEYGLNQEISNRTSAISAEATARENADNNLQNAINIEETSRISADNTKVNKSGDTMTGTLKISGTNEIRFGTDDNFYSIRKHSNGDLLIYNKVTKGLFLYSGDNKFAPYYYDGTKGYRLLNTGDAMNNLLRPPQFNAGVNITSIFTNNQTYTPTAGGWIYAVSDWTGVANDSYYPFSFSINGVSVADYAWAARDGRDGYGKASTFFWISGGQVLTQNTHNEAKINAVLVLFYPGVNV